MKHLFLLTIALLFATGLLAQHAALTVFSDMPGVKFRVYLNGEKQNNFHQEKLKLDDLAPGKYKLIVSFKQERIADCILKTKLEAGKERIISVEKKKPLKRKLQRIGRNIGNKLNKEEGSDLSDPYYLEDLGTTPIKESKQKEEKEKS